VAKVNEEHLYPFYKERRRENILSFTLYMLCGYKWVNLGYKNYVHNLWYILKEEKTIVQFALQPWTCEISDIIL
jgi:hypothetical protein